MGDNNIQSIEIESSEIISQASSEVTSEATSEIVLESGEEISIEADNTESTASELVSEPTSWPEGGKDAFLDHALPIMGLGMLGIFIVLGLIAIATISINKLFPAKKKGKED